ncbi:MAG: methyltransferase domain-containing protein [Rhodospirillales bacterium]|nr:methyltransferase domain-containing protein [Rhodospirillales bacterium]
MWIDIVDLRDFYATDLGRVTRRMVRRKIRAIWPDVSGQNVLGLGYAGPYLQSFQSEAQRVVSAMPAGQGVLHWPDEAPNLTALVDELELPFADLSMDRVILVHALECAEQVRPMMREIWRVLAGSGRLMVIAPNRRGLWARFEKTPFGHGLPYSKGQLTRLLRDNMFTPIDSHRALYMPPVQSRMILSAAPALENIGSRFFSTFAGVIVMEATKQIYAGQPLVERKQRHRIVMLPQQSQRAPTTKKLIHRQDPEQN